MSYIYPPSLASSTQLAQSISRRSAGSRTFPGTCAADPRTALSTALLRPSCGLVPSSGRRCTSSVGRPHLPNRSGFGRFRVTESSNATTDRSSAVARPWECESFAQGSLPGCDLLLSAGFRVARCALGEAHTRRGEKKTRFAEASWTHTKLDSTKKYRTSSGVQDWSSKTQRFLRFRQDLSVWKD